MAIVSKRPAPKGKEPAKVKKARMRSTRRKRNKKVRSWRKTNTKKSRGKYGETKSKSFFRGARKRYDGFDKHGVSGVVTCRERGTIIQSDTANAQWIGHSTLNRVTLTKDIAKAICKFIAIQLRISLSDMNMYINASNRYLIQLGYKQNITSSVTYLSFTTTLSQTWATLANNIAVSLETNVLDATLNGSDVTFTTLFVSTLNQIAPDVAYDRKAFDLSHATISVLVKSSLKLQNQSYIGNTVNEEQSDLVDNVPLYGKYYEGSGNFIELNKGIAATSETNPVVISPLITGTIDGMYMSYSVGPDTAWNEPPKLSQVGYANKIGKAHIDPGQIKTSSLLYSKVFKMSKLMQLLARGEQSPTQDIFWRGNYRVFCLEKMLQATATSATNKIIVGIEVDNKIGVTFKAKPLQMTTMVIDNDPN